MPPIPLAQETQNLISSLDGRQKHIYEVQIPALRQCTGPLSLQQKLAEELKDAIDAHSRQTEDLGFLVDDQQGEKARRELRAIVDTFREALGRMRKDTRSALLLSKKAIESHRTAHRDELLSLAGVLKEKEGNQSNYGASNEKFGEDALMKANADVTDALRRTIAAMQNELERSVLSNQMLESSSASLHATSSQHDKLSSFMITSKHLVTALEKSDWLDRVIIISAFMFFLLVVMFILKQRFVDRGLRIALWWTRFIPDFGGDEALLKSEDGLATQVVATVTSSLSLAASAALSSLSSHAHSTPTLLPSETLDVVSSPISTETDLAARHKTDARISAEHDRASPAQTTSSDRVQTEGTAHAHTPAHVEL